MNPNFNQAAMRGQQIIIEKLILPRMREKKLSPEKIGALTGLNYSTIYKWMSGNINISLLNFLKICGALDINPFFEVNEEESPEMWYEYFN